MLFPCILNLNEHTVYVYYPLLYLVSSILLCSSCICTCLSLFDIISSKFSSFFQHFSYLFLFELDCIRFFHSIFSFLVLFFLFILLFISFFSNFLLHTVFVQQKGKEFAFGVRIIAYTSHPTICLKGKRI